MDDERVVDGSLLGDKDFHQVDEQYRSLYNLEAMWYRTLLPSGNVTQPLKMTIYSEFSHQNGDVPQFCLPQANSPVHDPFGNVSFF